jgi:hypothetical protein
VLVSDLRPGSPFKYLSPDRKYSFVTGTILEKMQYALARPFMRFLPKACREV